MQHFLAVFIRLFILSIAITFSTSAHAESLESLLMPGPVIEGHKKYEEDCEQCHDTSDKSAQGKLCVKCHAHENIIADLSDKKGFHGRLPAQLKKDCKHCHTEHKGRDAIVVLLDPSNFDHRKTDFVLKGTHIKVPCDSCHKPEKKYSEAPGDCYSCHKKVDVHKGKQGKKCGDCHKETNWKDQKFDHDKTDFPLKGKHEDTNCQACHINQKYKDTPKVCYSCHQIQDVHKGDLGKKCETCHNPEKWDSISFDHNKKTDFPLYGKHKKAACTSCHSGEDLRKHKAKKAKIPTNCYSCHKNDDSHKGRYGEKCKDCHSESSWKKQKFNHDKTEFPLKGKHKKAACNLCHKGDLYEDKLKTACITCHKKDDVHKGKQGRKCEDCHNAAGWHSNVLFDHDLADFPLIGMHATTQCEECHLTEEYGATESECNQCHAHDDVHKTRLGTDCETCHNPNSWMIWQFDHDKATDFTIDGAHEDLGCYDCHRTRSKGKLSASSECIACHRRDDIHNREFGRDCGRCHSTKSFRDIKIKR